MKYEYTAYFCEENIYRLAASNAVPDGWVVFIYSQAGACPIWNQRAGGEGQAVFWDYHVIYASDGRVWDLDSVYGPELDLADWLRASFPLRHELPPEYRPILRMVARDEFLEIFSSDRSHMKKNGEWLEPLPSWDAIFDEEKGMNLDEFRCPGAGPGNEVSLEEFAGALSA